VLVETAGMEFRGKASLVCSPSEILDVDVAIRERAIARIASDLELDVTGKGRRIVSAIRGVSVRTDSCQVSARRGYLGGTRERS
jgi:hypothetical protein